MTQLDALHQNPIQSDKHRHLDQHRQAATEGIYLLFLVQLHRRLLHLGTIVAIAFLELLHLGHQLAHSGHGTVLSFTELVEDCLHDHCQEDDRQAPVSYHGFNLAQYPVHGGSDEPQPAVIDSEIQVW